MTIAAIIGIVNLFCAGLLAGEEFVIRYAVRSAVVGGSYGIRPLLDGYGAVRNPIRKSRRKRWERPPGREEVSLPLVAMAAAPRYTPSYCVPGYPACCR